MTFLQGLVNAGLLEQEQSIAVATVAEEKYDNDVFDALSKETDINQEALLNFKSEFFGVPPESVSSKDLDPRVLEYISEDSARQYGYVPVGVRDNVLSVGIVDPGNTQALDALQFISSSNNTPYKLFVITRRNFDDIIGAYKGLSGEVDQALSDLDTELAKVEGGEIIKQEAKKGPAQDEKKIVEEAPIIKVVAVILRHAVEGLASDIHIEHTGKKVKVRFRVDGELHTSLTLPLNVYNGVIARIKILAKLRLDEKRKPQDGGFSAKINGRKIDFRVSTMPGYHGEKIVMRILDPEKGVKSIDEIEMSESQLKMVREAIRKPYGLILITGPTGSGKTTTLYSMLKEVDREGKNVVSLEDPVEYQVEGVNQSQVMPEIGYTFASGLRSILRQDPDVILVGEIRDKETAKLAIQASLTGHLVLSTLHTNNSAGVIPRLVDMGVDPYLIAPTLILAMAQRLAKKTCADATQQVPVDEATRTLFEKQFSDLPEQYRSNIKLSQNMLETISTKKCPSGTKGRMAIFEMFEIDKELQATILDDPTELNIYNTVRKKGMLTMKEDALIKAMNGQIPLTEVYKF